MNLQYRVAALAVMLLASGMQVAFAQAEPKYDVRDITVGMPVGKIPDDGYINLTCANDSGRRLPAWSAWRECPMDEDAMHAVRFDFDPQTSREGTLVAGHPVILTALIDDAGIVAGLKIETDPKARLYIRKEGIPARKPGKVAIWVRRLGVHARSAGLRRNSGRWDLSQGKVQESRARARAGC
jgi:hypothetical protein